MPFYAHFKNVVAILFLSNDAYITGKKVVENGLKLGFELGLTLIEQNIGIVKTKGQILIKFCAPPRHIISKLGLKIFIKLGAQLVIQNGNITDFIALRLDIDHKDHGYQHEHHHQTGH